MSAPIQKPDSQRGVALAMLLWFIAAMLILVAGLASLAKMDVRLAQWQVHETKATALGDGAAQLLLRDLLYERSYGDYPGQGIFRNTYNLGEKTVNVRAVPVTGLIDLNQAGELLLTDLFHFRAGLDVEAAERLAQRVVVWRSPDTEEAEDTDEYLAAGLPHGPRHSEFVVPEDLLQVMGVTRDIYASVGALIHASPGGGSSRINLMSAPWPMFKLMAAGDEALAWELYLARAEAPWEPVPRVAGLLEEHLGGSGSLRHLRIDARVAFDDGKILQRRLWVDLNESDSHRLPWRVDRVEPVRRVDTFEFTAREGAHGD